MARIATATKTTKPAPRGRKPTRRATPIAAKTGAKAKTPKAPGIAAVSKRASAAPAPEPKVSKEELRARLEKLERANAALRAKSREANRAAKTAAARIAELEDQVAQLERERGIDPGDAVPPGVAVEEPALLDALDAEAETALENLEHHLGGA